MGRRQQPYARTDDDRIVKICNALENAHRDDPREIIKREAAQLIRELAARVVMLENELYDEVTADR